jgi:hypothetical protein
MRPLRGKVGSLLWLQFKLDGPSGPAPIRPCVKLLHQTFLPRPTKEWPCELLGPWAFRGVFHPFGGPGGYSSPTSPRSLGWFWNNRPKDPRSSLQFFYFDKECLENKSVEPLLLNSEWSDENDLLLSSSAIIPQNSVFCLGFMLWRSAFAL